jgi:hypothetical protein
VLLDLGIVAREPASEVIELCVEAGEFGSGGLSVAGSLQHRSQTWSSMIAKSA